MNTTLVDSNLLLDIATNDPVWFAWSYQALEAAGNESSLAINPLIFAEISVRYDKLEDLEDVVPTIVFRREPLPYEAAFLASKAFLKYRRRGRPTCIAAARLLHRRPCRHCWLSPAHERREAVSHLFSNRAAHCSIVRDSTLAVRSSPQKIRRRLVPKPLTAHFHVAISPSCPHPSDYCGLGSGRRGPRADRPPQ
jgi:hypothetical protein